MFKLKIEKIEAAEGIEPLNQESIRTLGEKQNYKYLGILEADTIKQMETKEKLERDYLRRTRKLLETNLCRKILIHGINTRAVSFVR